MFVRHALKFRCPVHGDHESYIRCTTPGHDGIWCQLCWVDTFDRLGIQRMTEIPPEVTNRVTQDEIDQANAMVEDSESKDG